MKKITLLLVVLLPFFMFAENLFYYSNGRKISLSETSGYTFIDGRLTKNAVGLPKNLKFMLRHENIFLFEELSSENRAELEKHGKILPAYIRNGGEKVYASGMIFVKISGVDDVEKWCRTKGLSLVKKFKYAPDWYLVSTNENPVQKSVELVEKKIAAQAEPSFFMNFEKRTYIPNDPLFFNQWHLHNFGDASLTGTDHTHVADAWDLMLAFKGELGGSNVKLAIIDDGFDLTHEDFQGRFLAGYDFGDGDDNPMPGNQNSMNPDQHGTSVAGVAGGATDNGIGIAGACPNCQLIPIRMNMSGITSLDASAIEAFEWAADAGADIISNSWGPADGTGQTVDMNQTLKDLVANITTTGRNGLGTVILFAAGNGGESIETDGFASNPNVFAIGATNASGNRASYSDFGNSLDFMASSCDIDSSGGDGWSGGSYIDGIWTTDNTGSSGYNAGNTNDGDALGNYTNSFGGTSSACPLAAGITGLVLTANPNLTKDQIYEIYKETSDKNGLDPYDANGFNTNYGYGRLNACEAVKKAFEMAGTDMSGVVCGETPVTPEPTTEPEPTPEEQDVEPVADEDNEPVETPDSDSENQAPTVRTKDSGCSLSLI